jgi:hypothetical protein
MLGADVGRGAMGTHEAFWIDDDFDRERADGDVGRYAAQVRRDTFLFADTLGDISPVGFACAAWRIATPPWLDPGLIRWHRRILSALCVRNRYDGSLIGQISLVSPLPAALTWSNQWWHDRGWREWPQTFGQFLQPTEQDLAKSPHIRASLLIEVPMSVVGLPAAPEGPDEDLAEKARLAVTFLVRELNDILTPIVRQLEHGVPADQD